MSEINGEVKPIPQDSSPIDGTTTKSAAKKEAKRLEKSAKAAAKLPKDVPTSTSNRKQMAEKAKKVEDEQEEYVNNTIPGEKKDLSQPMGSGYNPIAVESAWYDWWEKQGFFLPQLAPDGKSKSEGLFVIASPPPNVTGSLHLGHALMVSLQDAAARWNRMLGKTVAFMPGFDHAGISTQSVVESRLFKTNGQTRHDLGREVFVNRVWNWKNEYQARITKQLRRMGGSYDWSRVAFTMDDNLSRAVVETFCRLHEEGILYRANRLVNWCVRLNTTLSSLEVEQKELNGRTLLTVPGYDPKERFEFGVITSFAYPIKGSDERIVVATTRPETMLGDTAIAVHPDDPRYTHLHGKFAVHPFLPDRQLPIITDSIIVDPEFGTGAVKITPAHDPNDYEVGKRHDLEFINILNDDGTFNEHTGQFKGMKRFHARNAVVQALKDRGLYVDTKDNPMSVPICSKSKDIIEPVMKPQWWVSCKPLADAVIERTRAGELRIAPKQSESDWYRWLESIQDWCVSRQLWWGHRCPAYFVKIKGEAQEVADGRNWVVGRTLEEATTRAAALANGKPFVLEQDPDVLDTWFSSGLWPFSIQGWPVETADYRTFYPSTFMETGWDIIFFWVARMAMLGVHLTGKMPFEEVFCHAMVRDAHGRKMSKSLGNVIDPVDVIEGVPLETLHKQLYEGNLDDREIQKAIAGQKKDFPNGIPQCGTDALRFALCAYTSSGRDINLEILRVEGYRKFCNKIFNATKFAMLKLDDSFTPLPSSKPTGQESIVERWVLDKLNFAAVEVNKHMAERNFMMATTAVYNFWLYELCDVYIEAMKPMTEEDVDLKTRSSAQNTLYTCLDLALRLLHPFMPFVTEELWQRLPRRPQDATPSIMVASYPVEDASFAFPEAAKDFDLAFAGVKTIRSMTAQYNVRSNVQAFAHSSSPQLFDMLQTQASSMAALIKGCQSVKIVREQRDIPLGCASAVLNAEVSIHLLVKGQVDIDAELVKTGKKLEAAEMNASKIRKIETQADYEKSVPEHVRLANSERLKTLEAEIATLTVSKQMFQQLKE